MAEVDATTWIYDGNLKRQRRYKKCRLRNPSYLTVALNAVGHTDGFGATA